MTLSNSVRRLFLVGTCVLGAAASSFAQVTREEQAALTPQAAFTRLVEGHERFLQGRPLTRDLPASVAASARGQYPAAMVISCIDSRTAAEFIFDQGTGDLFCGRIAGNFVDDLMLGSIEFGLKVARAPLVVVLGHTECGAVKGACSGVKLGHLTNHAGGFAAGDPSRARRGAAAHGSEPTVCRTRHGGKCAADREASADGKRCARDIVRLRKGRDHRRRLRRGHRSHHLARRYGGQRDRADPARRKMIRPRRARSPC